MKMVRITRSVTVSALTPVSGYVVNYKRDNERLMTDSEIVRHEKGMPDEDQAQAIIELMEIAHEDNISFTCQVTIEEVPDSDLLRCPTCTSRQPSMHPAAGEGGEVTHICPDPFHGGSNEGNTESSEEVVAPTA